MLKTGSAPNLLPLSPPPLLNRIAMKLLISALVCGPPAFPQTAFMDFNTTGQYTNNFVPWNDGGGIDAGSYSFQESQNAGVAGSGGVSVFQSTDMTATYA